MENDVHINICIIYKSMKNQTITVIGYYDHNNTGDEQYKLTFKKMIEDNLPNDMKMKYNIRFLDCDKLKRTEISEAEIIIMGGGDILNNYFLDEINEKFKNRKNKIIAVSVGLPYINILVKTEKLSIIDYIFLRTEQDMETFGRYFQKDRLFYLPDISYYLKKMDKPKQKNEMCNILDGIKKSGRNIIAFCLNRHIYSSSRDSNYKDIVSEFAKTVEFLVEQKYFIVLLPFNTNGKVSENDVIFHTDIYNLLDKNSRRNVLNITHCLDVMEMYDIFTYFYLVIPMRFHACLFSIYQNVPLIPILTTKKVTNVLLDIKWTHSYKLDTDENDIPLKMESSILISKINDVLGVEASKKQKNVMKFMLCGQTKDGMKELKESLLLANDVLKAKMVNPIKELMKIITSKNNDKISTYINVNKITIDVLIKKLCEHLNQDKLDLSNISDESKRDVVEMVSFYLTNGYDSKYNYGLMSKMFEWILCDNQKNGIPKNHNVNGLFNMNFVDQNDYSGTHRSGWQHVINALKEQNNDLSDILLDLSIDKTFHWKENIGKSVGIIPYKKEWVGFLHHTFDTTFSEYNCEVLLKKESFRDSLPNCRGIMVFSKQLKEKLEIELKKIGFEIKISVLCHPTDLVNLEEFKWSKFLSNNDKKVVNVGGWMRNIFSFYNLFIPRNYSFETKGRGFISRFIMRHQEFDTIRKVALKGRCMDNYFPKENKDENEMMNDIAKNIIKNCCQHQSGNNWYKHNEDYIDRIRNSVDVIEHLCDTDYDKLLSENIVFLNLIDASAVNTVIECIIRNTPLIINRRPAIVEILGDEYPLYYGDSDGNTDDDYSMNHQVVELLSDTKKLKSAYKYLMNFDKTRFSVGNFMTDFTKILTLIDATLSRECKL
jgi:exopolysaccharide biosynthesis predicted pyruvyltransferase EpsI